MGLYSIFENDKVDAKTEFSVENEVSCCDIYEVSDDFSNIVLTSNLTSPSIAQIIEDENKKETSDANFLYQANSPLKTPFPNVYSRALIFLNSHDLSSLVQTPLQVKVYETLLEMNL